MTTSTTNMTTPAASSAHRSILADFTLCTNFNCPSYFVTFSGNSMRFSNACMDALNEADYIQIFVDRDQKQLAIRPASPRTSSKFSFLRNWKEATKKAQREGRRIPQKEAKLTSRVAEFREVFGIEGNQKFFGEFYESEGIIVFDLKDAAV